MLRDAAESMLVMVLRNVHAQFMNSCMGCVHKFNARGIGATLPSPEGIAPQARPISFYGAGLMVELSHRRECCPNVTSVKFATAAIVSCFPAHTVFWLW